MAAIRVTGPASSNSSLAVLVLQTAASLENLAAAACTEATALARVKSGSALVSAAISRNAAHHAAHARAFNEAVVKAGGAAQHAPDPRYAAPVRQSLAAATDLASVVSLLAELEDVNAQSYVRYASLASESGLRSLFVDVASVEVQHRASLLIVQHLLGTGNGHLLGTTVRPAELPRAVGTVGTPEAAYPTSDASAINEGAVH